jgi:predicted aspartyl protease
MGKVLVAARIENAGDLFATRDGRLSPDAVRRVDVADALVEADARFLWIPRRQIEQLGLKATQTRTVRLAHAVRAVEFYDAVRLTVQGRDCTMSIAAIADDSPVVIGSIPLLALDFVVDAPREKLIGNPDHGGDQMLELFTFLPASTLGRL